MDLLGRAGDPRVKAVIETHLDQPPAVALTLDQALDLGGGDAGGLLDEHVSTRLKRSPGEGGELIVDGRDDDHIGLGCEQLLQSRARSRAVAARELSRRPLVDVVAGDELVVRPQRGRPLGPDQAAADYRHAQAAHVYSLA
jgi:hypothetical protein